MRTVFPVFISLLLLLVNSCYAEKITVTEIKYDNDIQLRFEETPFDKQGNIITECGENTICLINNQPLWGSDGKIPETSLKSLTIIIQGKSIPLDTSCMFDPLVSSEKKTAYSVSHYFADSWKVRGRFSDGAGTYYAEWLVTKQASVRTLLGDSELLYDAFENLFKNK